MRPIPPNEAAPFIACVLAAGEAQDRIARLESFRSARPATQMPPPDRREGYIPSAADFGLTAREAGMWGRLRASGLSDEDAADVVKAARMGDRP